MDLLDKGVEANKRAIGVVHSDIGVVVPYDESLPRGVEGDLVGLSNASDAKVEDGSVAEKALSLVENQEK